jgi:hypothetical protein
MGGILVMRFLGTQGGVGPGGMDRTFVITVERKTAREPPSGS